MVKNIDILKSLNMKLRWIAPAIIVGLYILSRVILYAKGVVFIAGPVDFAMQYLDPILLKNDLFQSLLYLHAQPPLFNAFIGLVLKISPIPDITFDILFKTAGLLLPLMLYGTLQRIGLNRLAALMITTAYMLNPTLLLYENLLYYTYAECLFVLAAVFFLAAFCHDVKRTSLLICFWLALLCLGMVRSIFQPVFFIIIAVALSFLFRFLYQDKQLAKKCFFSFLIIMSPLFIVCSKNYVLYDFWGTSSWAGMSLWTKTNGFLPEELEELHAKGDISSHALKADLRAFKPIGQYFDLQNQDHYYCHHPADCNEYKSTRHPNYNHAGYVILSKQLWHDACALIQHKPDMFMLFTAGSYSLTLWHASDSVHALFKDNMEQLRSLEQLYRYAYFGFLGIESKYSPNIWTRTISITILFLISYGVTLVFMISKNRYLYKNNLMISVFCIFIHVFTLTISSFVEFGENNRFRTPVDSALLVILVINYLLLRQKGKCYNQPA